MIKAVLGVLIYKIAPIHSGAKYCQNFAARHTNPPIIIPNNIARLISEKCYSFSKVISDSLRRPHSIEFENSLIGATTCAIHLIQGVEDDVFESRRQALGAYPWLEPALISSGIKLSGIRPIGCAPPIP
jgi:hypothetical protein